MPDNIKPTGNVISRYYAFTKNYGTGIKSKDFNNNYEILTAKYPTIDENKDFKINFDEYTKYNLSVTYIKSLVKAQSDLEDAVVTYNIEAFDKAIEEGAEPNLTGSYGIHATTLQRAFDDGDLESSRFGHEQILAFRLHLLSHPKIETSNLVFDLIGEERKPNILRADQHQTKRLDVIKVAIHNVPNFDINKLSPEGDTVLIRAVNHGRIDVVKELLKTPGIDINLKDSSGKTALMNASEGTTVAYRRAFIPANIGFTGIEEGVAPNYDILNVLLKDPKIDVSIKDNEGKTAREYRFFRDIKD